MLARLQKFITLGLLAFVCAWALIALQFSRPGWAVGGLAIVLAGYTGFMAFEFIVMGVLHRDDPAPRPRLGQIARAWWAEVTTSPAVFCWQQPFRSHVHPDYLPSTGGARAVVLVHGYVCNRGFWNAWMPRLRAQKIPHVAINLEPVFGSIHGYADAIDAAARRAQSVTGRPVVIVAHSMGGLAVRAWLTREGAAERVHRVVTIGTPHHGTWTARFGTTDNAVEMRSGSPLLGFLAEREPRGLHGRFTCFYSHCDNIVHPASTGALEGADNRHVEGAAHVDMVHHPAVYDEVVRLATQDTAE